METLPASREWTAADRARFIRGQIPPGGLFAGQDWRIAAEPFALTPKLAGDFEKLGRVLLRFYQSTNLLYQQSVAGKQPAWVAGWLDQGKPDSIIDLQRSQFLKSNLPAVIRPDILWTENGWVITELDSVPGGIGLTAWLNDVYTNAGHEVIGGTTGMREGFANIFGDASAVRIVVSEESDAYRPEMEWLSQALGSRFTVHGSEFENWNAGDSVYRFLELFDLANVPCAGKLLADIATGRVEVTPPPKAFLEEKILLALLWNDNLKGFWRRELGRGFFQLLRSHTPQSWILDPSPLPPHAGMPRLEITDWRQLCQLSQRERELVLKVSGFSPQAWGARGVRVGSDMSREEWGRVVDQALGEFDESPWILQRFHKPKRVQQEWFDFDNDEVRTMHGRARLCPYYFVNQLDGKPEAVLGGVLATVCPADKKIIHGMSSAILAPCSISAA